MEASSSTSTMVSSDPVSSLRAAALSTLKSKRRKAAVEKPISVPLRPPPPSDSFQLDYGQEDNNRNTSKSDAIPSVSEVPESKEKLPVFTEVTQMREEGEISDEEGPPTVPMQTDDHARKSTKSPVPVKSVTPEPNTIVEARPTPPPLSPSPRSLTPEMQPAVRTQLQSQEHLQSLPQPPPTLMDRLSNPETFAPAFKQEEGVFDVPVTETSEQQYTAPNIGPDRVRPGLDLNQKDYDTVKDIILDLLGWGVPFDFLVDCGISKEVVYYVFNELELRLPDDFDSSGIIPYTPETIIQLQQSVLMPPPPLPERQRRDSIETNVSAKMDSSANALTSPVSALDTPPPPVDSPRSTDLHDMERRRRQELLARKAAAQASRKQKQHMPFEPSIDTSHTSDAMVIDQDSIDAAPYVATETVEDFLNSLSAVKGLETTIHAVATSEAESIPMNVDQKDQSSGDQTIELDEREETVTDLNSAVSEQFSISSIQSQPFTEAPPPSTEPPPTSVGSSTSNFSYLSSSTPSTPIDLVPRRGVKRPVAADFVDFEPTPKRHEHTSQIDRTNGSGSITRRLTTGTSFQNINSRRCVIDLSDSEDEGEDPRQRLQEDQMQSWRDKRAQLRKFPSPAPIKSVTSGTMSPAALQQKELEIRKMRELIAQREEETRLRKLALARSASATNAQPSVVSTPVSQPTPLKVEDVDVAISASTPEASHEASRNPRSSESATPPWLPDTTESPIGDNTFHDINMDNATVEHQGKSTPSLVPSLDAPLLLLTFYSQLFSLSRSNARLLCSNLATFYVTVTAFAVTSYLTSEAQESQADHAFDSVMTAQEHESTDRSVDADQNPSPSTQMEATTPPLVHRKQDASTLEDLQPVSHNQPFQEEATFSSYRSPFELYPHLRDHGETVSSASHSLSPHSLSHMYPSSRSSLSFVSHSVDAKPSGSSHSSSLYRPDLKPLKLATLAKLLDPFKRLCQYEVPGGGTCRDDGCEDIHLSKLEGANRMGTIEPNDEDTAEYLFNALPPLWLRQYEVASPSRILMALRDVYSKTLDTPLQFEDRVAQTLDSLGSPPTT